MTPLRQVVSTLRRAVHRTTWRTAMQSRASRVARLRWLLPRHVSVSTTAARHVGGWRLLASNVLVITLVVHTPGRTMRDLCAPMRVIVHVPRLVDLARLQASLAKDALLEVEGAM